MSTITTPARLMRCPACGNPIEATITYAVDFDGPQPELEVTAKVTAKVSSIQVFHDCRDGKPALTEQFRATAEVVK